MTPTRLSLHALAVALGLATLAEPCGATVSLAWTRHFDVAAQIDRGVRMDRDSQNRTYVVGSGSPSDSSSRLFVVATDASGNPAWSYHYAGAGEFDQPGGIAVDPAGGLYAGGTSWLPDTTARAVLIRLSLAGSPQWVRQISGSGRSTFLTDVGIDGTGNAVVTGYTDRAPAAWVDSQLVNFRILTVEIDAGGTERWRASEPGSRPPVSVLTRGDEVFVVASAKGDTTGGRERHNDILVVKYHGGTGVRLWSRRVDSFDSGDDVARTASLGPAGEVYVSAVSAPADQNLSTRMLTARVSNGGALEWSRLLDEAGVDLAPHSIAAAPIGGAVVAATVCGVFEGCEMRLIKYSALGTLLWLEGWLDAGTGGQSRIGRVRVDTGGNIYLAGTAGNPQCGSQDLVVQKWAANGALQDQAFYDRAGGWDDGSDAVWDGTGSLFVAGASFDPASKHDVTVVRYDLSGTVGVGEDPSLEPEGFGIQSLAVGRAGRGTLLLSVPTRSEVSLDLVDVSGRRVRRILDRVALDAGRHEREIDLSEIAPGIYFVQMRASRPGEDRAVQVASARVVRLE